MKIPIERIIIDDSTRIRKDPGNLSALENSIKKVGLLNPVVIDEENRLIAGQRRVMACKNIGMDQIEARVISFQGDLLKMLDAEVDENLFRKKFTPEEIAAIEERRQEILRMLRPTLFQRFWRWLKNLFRRKKKQKEDHELHE